MTFAIWMKKIYYKLVLFIIRIICIIWNLDMSLDIDIFNEINISKDIELSGSATEQTIYHSCSKIRKTCNPYIVSTFHH